MIATTAAYQAMAESQEQQPDYRVTITLPGGVYPDLTLGVKKLEINMSTVSDLPDQSRYQVGYTAAECTFTLAGLVDQRDETKTAAWLFGKYPTAASDGSTSPLYQQFVEMSPVTVDLGLQPAGTAGVSELLRKFTGYISYYTENSDGSVDFTCVDSRSLFKSAVTTLPVVTAPPYNAGLTSEFAVDMLCRAATGETVSSWPAKRPNCLLAAGMRSSVWPEVGTLATLATQPNLQFASGALGTGLQNADVTATGYSGVFYQTLSPTLFPVNPPTDAFVEFWINGVDASNPSPTVFVGQLVTLTNPIYGHTYTTNGFSVQATSTGITVTSSYVGFTTVAWSTAVSSGPHYVALKVHAANGASQPITGTVYLDGASQGVSLGNTATGLFLDYAIVTTGTVTGGLTDPKIYHPSNSTVEALQLTSESAPTLNNGFVPKAVLDPSLNSLQVIPATDGDPWSVIQQIADAELAVAGFDESGVFRFKNRSTIRGQQPVRTITSTMALKAVGVESAAGSVINRAQIPYATYSFGAPASTVWSLATAMKVPRGQTVTLTATVDTLFTNLDATIAVLPNGSTDTTASYYRASINSAGTAEHPGVSFGAITQTAADTLQFTVTNSSGQDAWLVSPANYTDVAVGTPLLRLAAATVTASDQFVADYQYPPASAGGAASTRWGEVAYQPSANPWLQNADTATTLVQDIVVDSCVPRPNLTNLSIVPDPRLQLVDVAHVVDSDRTGVDEYARIFSWTVTYEGASEPGGDASYEMTVDARTLAAPGGWITGVAGRSEVGTTAYVYPCT